MRLADTTRQARACAPLRTQRPPMSVDAGGCLAIFETLSVAHCILPRPAAAQDRLRHWLDAPLPTVHKREGRPFRNGDRLSFTTAEHQGNKGNQRIGLANLGQALRDSDALRLTGGVLRQTLVLTRELEDAFQEGVSLAELGCSLSTTGEPAFSHAALGRSQHTR